MHSLLLPLFLFSQTKCCERETPGRDLCVLCVQSLSHGQLFVTPWNVAHQNPLSMKFSGQEYWSGLPFPSPGDLPDLRIEPVSPALQADSLPSEPLHSIPPFLVTYILLINQQAAINSTFLIFFWISKITGKGYLIRKLLIKEIFLMSGWHWAQITSTLLGNLPQTFGQKKKNFFLLYKQPDSFWLLQKETEGRAMNI